MQIVSEMQSQKLTNAQKIMLKILYASNANNMIYNVYATKRSSIKLSRNMWANEYFTTKVQINITENINIFLILGRSKKMNI